MSKRVINVMRFDGVQVNSPLVKKDIEDFFWNQARQEKEKVMKAKDLNCRVTMRSDEMRKG